MPLTLVQLAYKQTIDANAKTDFEQQVFNATFAAFSIQQPSFANGDDLFTWSSIRSQFPKSDLILPAAISIAIADLLTSLDSQIPGLQDTLRIRTIPFIRHRLELIESDVRDSSVHKVSLIYFTDTMTLLGIVEDTLLLALGDIRQELQKKPVPTFLLKMRPELSICSYFEPVSIV